MTANAEKPKVFLAEGTRIVTEAFDLGWSPQHFVFLEGREDDTMVKRLIRQADDQGADVISVSEAVLSKLSRKDNPQMVLASFAENGQNPARLLPLKKDAGWCLIVCVIRAI